MAKRKAPNVREVKGKRGTKYQARVYVNGVAHARTFETVTEAKQFVNLTLAKESGTSRTKEQARAPHKVTFDLLADSYAEDIEGKTAGTESNAGKAVVYHSDTKLQNIYKAKEMFTGLVLADIDKHEIVERFEKEARRSSPYTAYLIFFQFRKIWRKLADKYGADPTLANVAGEVLRDEKTLLPPRRRERVLTRLEQAALTEFFQASNTIKLPMVDMMEFSLLTCVRVSELVRLARKDLVEGERPYIWVRDRKDAHNKKGNNMKVPLLGNALEILKRQPEGELFFPFFGNSVSRCFHNSVVTLHEAGKLESVDDLVWHSLRHTGITRYFEAGWTAAQVKQVSGHKDIKSLARYEHAADVGVFDLPSPS